VAIVENVPMFANIFTKVTKHRHVYIAIANDAPIGVMLDTVKFIPTQRLLKNV